MSDWTGTMVGEILYGYGECRLIKLYTLIDVALDYAQILKIEVRE